MNKLFSNNLINMFEKFNGGYKISDMQSSEFDWNAIPKCGGVYVVIDSDRKIKPLFEKQGSGGWFNDIDPDTLIKILENNWVNFNENEKRVLYIGKAGRKKGISNLRKRIKLYMRFGKKEPVAHRGGRYIWQLKNIKKAYIYWKEYNNSREMEKKFIQEFKEKHGKRPFANLRA